MHFWLIKEESVQMHGTHNFEIVLKIFANITQFVVAVQNRLVRCGFCSIIDFFTFPSLVYIMRFCASNVPTGTLLIIISLP